MPISKEDKQKYVEQFGKDANDTGSPEVQVAILTHRIRELTDHVKIHKKRQPHTSWFGSVGFTKKKNAEVHHTYECRIIC